MYLTYSGGVTPEDSDAEVLTQVARRLFRESVEEFREAHRQGMESFDAPTVAEHLQVLGDAIKREKRAHAKLREAIELRELASGLRAKGLIKLMAAG